MISNAIQLIIFLLAVKGSLSDDSLKVSKMLLQDQATIMNVYDDFSRNRYWWWFYFYASITQRGKKYGNFIVTDAEGK